MGKVFVIIVIVLAGIFIYSQNQPKSNTQKLSECNIDAGKLYDAERDSISNNSNSDKESYYQTSEQSYTKALDNCKELYGED